MVGDAKRMVTGFNHNVKHRGQAYHVQTEDSGRENPRIITHLFLGGNILASKKTYYGDLLGAEHLARVVRELMEEQHKEVLRNLVNGVYDEIQEALTAQARAYQPGQLAHTPAPQPAATPAAPAPAARPAVPAAPPAARAAALTVSLAQAAARPPAGARPATPPPLPPAQPVLEREATETLLGDDLVSEKSLDEVILSYLAEDLHGGKP